MLTIYGPDTINIVLTKIRRRAFKVTRKHDGIYFVRMPQPEHMTKLVDRYS